MKRMFMLLILGTTLYLLNYFFGEQIPTHASFDLTLGFFLVQTFVLLRLDQKTKEEARIIMCMLKITIRLLSALAFIFILMMRYDDVINVVLIQFIALYFVFMIFEIITALSNLRRNRGVY